MKESKFKLNDKVYIVDIALMKGADFYDIFNREPVIICGKVTRVAQCIDSDSWWYDIAYDNRTRYELNELGVYKSKKEAIEAITKEFEEYCIKIKKILGINKAREINERV